LALRDGLLHCPDHIGRFAAQPNVVGDDHSVTDIHDSLEIEKTILLRNINISDVCLPELVRRRDHSIPRQTARVLRLAFPLGP
jgi:hypothetical protein